MPNIKFIIPGAYEHCSLNYKLLDLLKNHPECFYEGVSIGAVYGTFQYSIFDGGRNFGHYRFATKEEIELVVDRYNKEYNVPVRIVCTNNQLQEKHYTDRFGNLVFAICENGFNEVTINDSGLEQWVREHYPQLKLISSTTKCLVSTNDLITELHNTNYEMVCLDYNLNHNKKFLEQLAPEDKQKCEFLCNAICPPACPSRKEHYKLNSLYSLSYGKPYHIAPCSIYTNTVHADACNFNNNISPAELYNYYVPNGFNLFKLEGRTLSDVENACNYVRYMVKPEHQMWILTQLLPDNSFFKTETNMKDFLQSFK